MAEGEQGGDRLLHAVEVIIDMDMVPAAADALVDRIGEKLARLPGRDTPPAVSPCIHRVHPSMRDQESESYEPKLVSIGPLHHGKKSLLPMQEVKTAYLRDLLERSPHNKLVNYVRHIRGCERRARAQYAEEIDFSVDDFVEMLVVDGCFVIEYFAKRVFGETSRTIPLSSMRLLPPAERPDAAGEPNPLFVLDKLFDLSKIPFTGTRNEPLTLMEISLAFLGIRPPMEKEPKPDDVLHLLHLQHLCLDPARLREEPLPCSCRQVALYPLKKAADLMSLFFFGLLYVIIIHQWPRCFSSSGESKKPRMIPSATELAEAGVRFRRKDFNGGVASCYLKVSFTEGTLEIPFFKVESSSCKLRNLIALEQCCSNVGSHFTSYGILMDNLINTEGDVAILRSAGIMESKLGSDAEVANLFNALCKGTHLTYDDHYNAPLFAMVRQYCEFAHHRWRANLVHKYFGSPWAFISLLGACLLALAATQTYFTVFPRNK